jgi:hypothetical protein
MFAGSHDLTVLDQASRILAKAKSLDEIKSIRDKAEAARTYVKAAKLGLALHNRAAEVKLRAERKAGEFLRSLRLRGGNRKSKRLDAPLKLENLGISRDQSKRWQRVATVTEKEFCGYLRAMNDQYREVTSAGLLRLARKDRARPRTSRPLVSGDAAHRGHEAEGSHELIIDLANHCQLLTDVLRPLYENDSVELERGSKRVVGRLLREMSQLIAQLKKESCCPMAE